MKKFTFMLVAAFMAVMSYAQTPAEVQDPVRVVEDNALSEQNTYKFDFLQHDRNAVTDQTQNLGDVADGVLYQEGFLTIENKNAADVNNSFQLHANMAMFFAYAGSQITFKVPYGSHIDRIDLDFSQWGAGSSFDTGSYSNTGNGRQTWLPADGDNVREVTLTVGGVVTRFYSITVVVTSDKAVEPSDEVLEAAEDYNINAIYMASTSNGWRPIHIQKTIQASYDEEGNIYLQGLAYYNDEAWVKGTVDAENNTITIEPQKWYEDEDGVTYFVGFDYSEVAGAAVLNIVENEDGTKTLVLPEDGIIAENDGQKETFDAWGYYGSLTVDEGEYVHPEPVVVPEGLETAEYILDGQEIVDYYGYWTELYDIRHPLQIGITEEGEVYIQGLSLYLPEAWVKGQAEFDEAGKIVKVSVPANQFMGTYEEGGTGYDFYLNDNTWNSFYYGVDFDYNLEFDVDGTTITPVNADDEIIINNFRSDYETYTVGDITPYIVPDVVEVPEGLKVEEFYFTADDVPDGTRKVAIDAANGKVYVQGLSAELPEAWVVGDVNTDDETVTFAANQYIGQNDEGIDLWLNFHGAPYVFDYEYDAIAALDNENAELATKIAWATSGVDAIIINQKWKDEYWEGYTDLFTQEIYDEYKENVTLERVPTLVPDAPEIQAVNAIMVGDGVVEITFNINTTMTYEDEMGVENVENIDPAQISYEFFFEKDGEWQPLVFTSDLYADLTEDQSEFAYDFASESINLGKVIIKDNVVGEWTKIGLKTYNRVPETETWRESEMEEVTLKNIATGIQEIAANENVSYTDLQGRQAQATAKGLLIKQVRTADGNVKSVKVVRK